ncbi:MAG: histidine--tRNA ligase family protein, partial [Crenarchaeota archaeon]|nr:histidine--tRNA ligase family protein [Thermoproteota archaeon]
MPSFQPVRGMRDIVGEEAQTITYIINIAKQVAKNYGYKEAITPIVESFELLSAKTGEEIRQRMFIFSDLGGRQVALRPEFTASIARITTTILKNEAKPLRIFSTGTVYRYDEPQKGRYREFWQANFELLGSNKPEADAEIILLANNILKNSGLTNYAIKLGHVGVFKNIMSQEKIEEKTQNAILQKMDKKDYESALALIDSQKCKETLQQLIAIKEKDNNIIIEEMKKLLQGYEKALEAVENLSQVLKLVTESGCEIKIVDP